MKYLCEDIPNNDLVDALSYVDSLPDPLVIEINQMITNEMNKMPQKDYLETIPIPKSIIIAPNHLQNDHERFLNNFSKISSSSYLNENDPEKLKTFADRSKCVIEHLRLQNINIELSGKYGQDAWLKHIKDLEAINNSLQNEKDDLITQLSIASTSRSQFQELRVLGNLQRVSVQMKNAKKSNKNLDGALIDLESQVKRLIDKEIELAISNESPNEDNNKERRKRIKTLIEVLKEEQDFRAYNDVEMG